MLALPQTFWPYLLSEGFRFVEVYEIEAFAGRAALYFSDQALTWDGNDYVALAVSRGPIKYTKDPKIPDCTVSFANASNLLRAYLAPDDTLTGARLTVRLLLRDASDALLSESTVRFSGRIEPPNEIDEERFELSVVGLLDTGTNLPRRRFQVLCPWDFANKGAFDGDGHCPYEFNTLANGAGTAAITLNLDAASTFENGDEIQIGGGAAVLISSGGGTTTLTLAAARTWSDNAEVRYADCDRGRVACDKREQLHSIGSFPGASITARLKQKQSSRAIRDERNETRRGSGHQRRDRPTNPINTITRGAVRFSDPTMYVPVLYGRRRIAPTLVEILRVSLGSSIYRAGFYAICEGEIDSIVDAFVDDQKVVDKFVSGVMQYGIYYRLGGPGIDDAETSSEYASTPTVRERDQNIDYRSFAAIAYSELAYLIAIAVEDAGLDNFDDARVDVDVRGLKVQLFNDDGSHDGSKVWSESPIWTSVDLCLSDRYGFGLLETDLDFSVIKPEADYCDVYVNGNEASARVTQAQGVATTTCKVSNTEGFILGRRVDIAGAPNTVEDIVSANELKLGSAVTQTVNDLVVQRPRRFETHVLMERSESSWTWLQRILVACRGYITYDAGKIQFRIERDHCKERLTDGGMEIWTSSTNLTNWVENLGSGQAEIHQDSALAGSTGTYSVRIDRIGATQTNFAGVTEAVTGFEPGRWYRITFKHKQDALSIGNACRLHIVNTTRSLDCKSDGITWAAPTFDAISQQGSTTATEYEFTFKFREDFATTDSVQIQFAPYFTGDHSVWYDDAELRGPYAGDFREFPTAPRMGWKEGSFKWSLDTKDRETNQIVVPFLNESNNFGADQVEVNDFVHQRTHPTKTRFIDGEVFIDRDQAFRVANAELKRARELGPGCEFLGTPPAIAIQPGDVILVSATVPGWTCKEQRVTDTESVGLGSTDELFTLIRTEEYREDIYPDTGTAGSVTPLPTEPSIGVEVTRSSGGVLDLSLVMNDSAATVQWYRIYLGTESGFIPGPDSIIGSTRTSRFTYLAPVAALDVLRYLKVLALTAIGTIQSDEQAVTILRAPDASTSYTDDFKFPATKATPGGWNAFSGTVGNVTDASDATHNDGTASMTAGIADGDDDAVIYHTFGDGSSGHVGRPYVRVDSVSSVGLGTTKLYYAKDRNAPVWVLWQTLVNAAIGNYYGPEETLVDYSKYAIKAEVKCVDQVHGMPKTGSITAKLYRVAFDQRS